MSGGYSLENAQRFGWSSVTGSLEPGRLRCLHESLVGPRVLDVGCGGGAYCEYLAAQGFETVGVDLHESFLAIARQRSPQLNFQAADVTSLPFDDKSFDSAICFDVLEHVDDKKAISELSRVARQRVIVAVPRAGDDFFGFNLTFATYRDTTHLRYYNKDTLAVLLKTVAEPDRIQIFPELDIPVEPLIDYLLEPRQVGVTGAMGMLLRIARRLGLPVDSLIERRGRRIVREIGGGCARSIPTGLIGVIKLGD